MVFQAADTTPSNSFRLSIRKTLRSQLKVLKHTLRFRQVKHNCPANRRGGNPSYTMEENFNTIRDQKAIDELNLESPVFSEACKQFVPKSRRNISGMMLTNELQGLLRCPFLKLGDGKCSNRWRPAGTGATAHESWNA